MGKTVKNCSVTPGRPILSGEAAIRVRGYTMVELMVVLAIVIVGSVIAVPLVQNASRTYRVRSAVVSLTGAIQATRYQAISNGYQYRLALSKANSNFQVQQNPCIPPAAACWANVGGTVPLSGSSVPATINQDTVLLFHPSGQVQATTGAQNMTLTYAGVPEVITVSNYGNINVSP